MPLIMPSPRTRKVPQIHESAFIAPTAVIIGDVVIGEGSNIWFGAVLRGDWGGIIIGKNTSIQENVSIHNAVGSTVEIGDDCIIGHHAMIHGPCTIGNGCLVGIGANVLHKSKMGDGAVLGSGAVLVGKEIPPRTLAAGVPATIKKQLPPKGEMEGAKTSGEYANNGKLFKEFFEKNPKYSNLKF
ncbi:MAG: gamma carbonic anhydrase family protein [Candidatus Bathyarchaeota archaeon]|nr:gamma carbonic anhydrase family protein [Candidatus Bathyarchaeota archaeon]